MAIDFAIVSFADLPDLDFAIDTWLGMFDEVEDSVFALIDAPAFGDPF